MLDLYPSEIVDHSRYRSLGKSGDTLYVPIPSNTVVGLSKYHSAIASGGQRLTLDTRPEEGRGAR